MKVLTVFGSPRKKGNTAKVLQWVEEELNTLGHEVERVNLMYKKVNGCIGCGKCKASPNAPGCIQKDDGNQIIDRMVQSDAVIYASPLYYWGFSALMKAFVDRCYCLFRGSCGADDHTSFVEGQRHALLVTAADHFENNLELLVTAFQRILVYDKARSAGELLVCNCTTPDKLGQEIKAQAVAFARQLAQDTINPYALLMPGGAPNMVPRIG